MKVKEYKFGSLIGTQTFRRFKYLFLTFTLVKFVDLIDLVDFESQKASVCVCVRLLWLEFLQVLSLVYILNLAMDIGELLSYKV